MVPRLTVVSLTLASCCLWQAGARAQTTAASTLNANGTWAQQSTWAHSLTYVPAAFGTSTLTPAITTSVTRSGNAVTAINITGGNTGTYRSPPIVLITGGNGTGATAVGVLDGTGKLVSITVTNGGSGYTANPTISVSREIVSFNMTNGGSGYPANTSPRVLASGGTLITGGSQALGYAVVNPATGTISSINIVSGGQYTAAPTGGSAEAVPEGIGNIVHFNTDITGNRILELGEERQLGQMILGDLSGSEFYTINAGTNGTANGLLTFNMGSHGGGHAFINKFQGGADVINAPINLESQLNIRVTTNRLTLNGPLLGNKTLTSAGNGTLALGGDNTGSQVGLWLWNRAGTGTGAQVLLDADTGNAVGGDIRVGNVSYGTAGHAVLQLNQGRTNTNQIHDNATVLIDGVNGRWGYFKLLGASERIGRIWDMNNGSVIENSEGEAAPSNAILTVGNEFDSYLGAHIRDRSSGTLLSNQGGKLGITKVGTGNLTLDGTAVANAIIYTGATTLQQGSLTLRNTTAFNSIITASPGTKITLDRTTTGAWNYDELILGSGDLLKTGIGPVTMSRTAQTAAGTRQFNTLNLSNGTLNLHGPANIAGSVSAFGIPGGATSTRRILRLTGTVDIAGGIDFKGRISQIGSELQIDSLGTTVLEAIPTSGNPTPQNVSTLDLGVVNVAGPINLVNADLVLSGNDLPKKVTTGGAGTFLLENITGLAVGMTVVGGGLPAGAKITGLDINQPGRTGTQRVTLNVATNIAKDATLVFGTPDAGRITGTPSITVANKAYQGAPTAAPHSGSIQLINSAASNNGNRLPDTAAIISKGGNFDFINEQLHASTLNFTETVGALQLQEGQLTLSSYQAASGRTSQLTFASLSRTGPGTTLEFLGKNLNNAATTVVNGSVGLSRNQVRFGVAPTMTTGILGGWAIINGTAPSGLGSGLTNWDWVTYDINSGIRGLAESAYKNSAPNAGAGWLSGDNIWLNSSPTLDTRRVINSLKIQTKGAAASYTLTLGNHMLSIQSGGIIANLGSHTITPGTNNIGSLTMSLPSASSGELFTHVETGRNLTIQAPIRDFSLDIPASTTTSGSFTVTLPANTATGLAVGMTVTSTTAGGIPDNTVITAISGTTITLSNAATVSSTANTLRFTGGSVGLVKSGLGTLTFSGNFGTNTYTGKTYINNGVVSVDGNGRLGAAPSVVTPDSLNLNGGTLLMVGNASFSPNRGVTVGAAGGKIQLGNNIDSELTFDIPGPITGIGTLELIAAGDLVDKTASVINIGTPTSANVFGGGIKMDSSVTYSSGIANIFGNNTIGGLFMESDMTVNLPGNNNFTAPIEMLTGTLNLSGTNTFYGQAAMREPLTLTGGTLKLASQNALGTGPLMLELANSTVLMGGFDRTISSITSTVNSRLSNSGTDNTKTMKLTFDTQLTQTYLGTISRDGGGNISLIKKGPATLNLLGSSNSFSGIVRIEEGTLNVRTVTSTMDVPGSLGSAPTFDPSYLVIDGGTLAFSPTGQIRTDRSFTLGAGATGGALVASGGTQTARVIMGLQYQVPGYLYISPPVAFTGLGDRTLTLGGINSGDNEFNLQLGDAASGRSAVMKIGSGTWLLSRDNKYSGLTTVHEGTLGVASNNALGSTATPTTANPANFTFTGNLPNGAKVSFANFVNAMTDVIVGNASSVPEGILANVNYYVVESTGTTFKVALTPGGQPVEFSTTGTNVHYVPNIRSIASTTANVSTNRFTGIVPNGTAINFNIRQSGSGTPVNGVLPSGLFANVTYYVINSDNGTFQISLTPNGAPLTLPTEGSDFYYHLQNPVGNDSFGVNVLGGFLDLRNVDYLSPENIYLEGGQLRLPARTTSTWAGNVHVNVNSNVNIGDGATLIMNGDLQGNRTLTQIGEGTMILRGESLAIGTPASGAPSTPDNNRRAYVLQAGTLVLDYSENNNSKLVDNATFQMGGSRRGGVLRLMGGNHEEIVNTLSLQAGNNKIYRDDGSSIIRLNNIARAVGSTLYFDLPRIAKADNANTASGILGAYAIIRDAAVEAYWHLVGSIDVNFTVDPVTDTFSTGTPHRLSNGHLVRISSTGTFPGGLTANTNYYVVGTSGSTFRLARTYNGMAIDIFNTGSGTHTVSAVTVFRQGDPALLAFAANPVTYPNSSGNGKIKVEIQYLGGFGPITSVLTGAGTEADPYHYVIKTTQYLQDIDDVGTPSINENDVPSNRGNSADAVVAFVAADPTAQPIVVASKGLAAAATSAADATSTPATFLYRRPGATSLAFTASPNSYAGAAGNGKIKVEIQYVGGIGPVTREFTGSGTLADPYHYLLRTTQFLQDLDNPLTPDVNESDVQANRGNSALAIFNFVNNDGDVANVLTVSRSISPEDGLADFASYPATFLAYGTNDSGSQELDWAKNGSTTSNFDDGFVIANNNYLNNTWGTNSNTSVSASSDRAQGSVTYSLRFANSGAATVRLLGGTNTIQSGGILVSPTVGANDSALNGAVASAVVTTQNQGNLQNFLLHQYNTRGDLIIGASIADRAPVLRVGRLSGNIPGETLRLINSLATTADLGVGMSVSGGGIAAGSVIVEIVDNHTVRLDRDTTQVAGQRNLLTFTLGAVTVQRMGSMSHNSDRRKIFGINLTPVGGGPTQLSTSDIYLGMPVAGPGIPAGATVAEINNEADIRLNVDHFFTGIVSNLTFRPSIGIEKLGPGIAVLAGNNTYSNTTFVGDGVLRVQSLTDGGVSGSLGISSNAAGNLIFNGGTLQFVGENSNTNRAFTLSEFAVMNIGHQRTEATFSGAVSGADRLEKSGSGTLVMKGNAGLAQLRLDEGTLRVQIVDSNPAPGTFSASNFGTTNLMSLLMAGGTLEVRGAQEGNISQSYGGALILEEGASTLRVVSVNGYDPNNLNNGRLSRTATVNIMGGEELVSLTRNAGGTLQFQEIPEEGGGAASIVLNIPVLERQAILPWATYADNTSNLVNHFATVEISTGRVVHGDSVGLYDIGISPAGWEDAANSRNLDISEGGRDPNGLLRIISGALVHNASAVHTMRYFTNRDATLTIGENQSLRLLGGAILMAGNVFNAQKAIVGPGTLTGGAVNAQGGGDMMLHNYNPAASFELGVKVVDDKVQSPATGVVVKGSKNLYFTTLPPPIYNRLAEGMLVSGPGIDPGTYVTFLAPLGMRTVILSKPAVASSSGGTYTFTAITNLVHTGVGTTRLTADNAYSGKTYVHGGVLRLDTQLAIPGGIAVNSGNTSDGWSHIAIEGGVLGLGFSDFSRALGSGNDQVEFKGNGGFAAYGADRTVTFGGSLGKLRYGNDGFVPDGSSFILGSHDATHKVSLLNPLDVGTFSQVVLTPEGPAAVEGELAGSLSGAGRLIKLGLGTLRLGATNLHSGGVEVAEGRLLAAGVSNVFGAGGTVRFGSSRTNTKTNAGLNLELEGGTTITNRLEVGNVNARSSTWLPVRQTDSAFLNKNVGSYASTAVVNGHPAMAYYDATAKDLRYVRATDARGLAWGTPVTVDSGGDTGLFPSLDIINGNPAISYYDATNGCLMFVRATDSSGVFWADPVVADANPVTVVAPQADGKVLVAGTFTRFDGEVRTRMARLNADGTFDPTFKAEFTAADGTLHAINGEIRVIVPQADGKIIIAGTFTAVHNVTRNRIARLNADGTLDASYNPNANGNVNVLIPRQDGTMFAAGNFTSIGGQSRARVARLLATGSADPSFTVPTGPNAEVRAMAVQPDGSVVVGGAFTTVGSPTYNRMARFDPTGAHDTSFNPNVNGEVRGLIVLPSGKILIGGLFGTVGGITRNRLALVNANGSVDTSFDLEVNNEVRSMLLQQDGKVLLAGIFTTIGIDTPRNSLARLNVDGSGNPTGLDASFDPNPNFEVRGVAQFADGKLAIGGIFTNVGNSTNQWVAKLNSDGTSDSAFSRKPDDLGRNSALTSVGGNPAIAYRDEVTKSLKYIRAADVNGATWTTNPRTVDAQGDTGHGIAIIVANVGGNLVNKTHDFANPNNSRAVRGAVANNGMPVIAYYSGDVAGGQLKYVVADDAAGNSWGTPMLIPNAGSIQGRPSMQLIDASDVGGPRPAIAYYDPAADALKFTRATNSGGVSTNLPTNGDSILLTQLVYAPQWLAPLSLGTTGPLPCEPNLQMINGQPTTTLGTPAISYYDSNNGDLMLVRAANATGTSWNAPAAIVSAGNVGRSSGLVMIDGVVGISYYDIDFGDLKFITLSDASGYSRLAVNGNTTWQGQVALDGPLMVSPANLQTLTVSGAVTGLGGLKMAGAGIMALTNAVNNFGTAAGQSGAAVDGGLIIRSGTVSVGHSNALGSVTVELGDSVAQILTASHETTVGSVTLNGGRFDPTHNGIFTNAVPQIGAFVGLRPVINGQTYTAADVGKLILVKDEVERPERNGLYRISSVAANLEGVMEMILVRDVTMDTVQELSAGTRVHVQSSGKTYFLAGSATDLNISPVHWVPDQAAPAASLLASVSGLTISNAIDVNADAGSSLFSVGAASSIINGNVTFSGPMKLQNQKVGVVEAQTVTLTSHTSTGQGVLFTGLISDSAEDLLSLAKAGPGRITLPNANTYRGGTTVNEGTLLVMNTTGSATGTGPVMVSAGAVLGGTGTIQVSDGKFVTVRGTPGTPAILRPGDPNSSALPIETLTINAPLELRRESIVEYTLATGNYTQVATNDVQVAHVTARLSVLLAPGFSPAVDQVFKIVNATTGLSSTINWADYLNLPTSIIWDTSNFQTLGEIKSLGTRAAQLITSHPVSQTVVPGASVTFSVSVLNTINPSYQWRKNGVNINGATGPSLQLNNVAEADEGNYSVVVDLMDGTPVQTSWAAALAVENPPQIVTHPQSIAVNRSSTAAPAYPNQTFPGVVPNSTPFSSTATFSVAATSDPEVPITGYQWLKDGVELPGQTGTTLTLTNVGNSHAGVYRVRVSNAGGNTLSNPATLTVKQPAAFTALGRPAAPSQPIAEGFTHTYTTTATGADLMYQWERRDPGTPTKPFVVIAGATSSSYTTPRLTVAADHGAEYRVTVYNSFSWTRAVVVVAVQKSEPKISKDPENQLVLSGSTLNLSVTAGGVFPLNYQWKRNNTKIADGSFTGGVVVSGATTGDLSIQNISTSQAGAYTCEVTSGTGVLVASAVAYVVVVSDSDVRMPLALGASASMKATIGVPTFPKPVAPNPANPDHVVTTKWRRYNDQGVGTDVVMPDPSDPKRVTTTPDGRTLNIKNLGAADSARYVLEVKVLGKTIEGRVAKLEVFSEKPELMPFTFPTGIVGGAYDFQIPYNDAANKSPSGFAWAGDTKSTQVGNKTVPAGLKLDGKTGKVTGRPTKPGTYILKVTASNSKEKTESTDLVLVVEDLPANLAGDYAGPLPRSPLNENMGGRFDLKVTSTGSFTGKLTMGGSSLSYSGLLDLVPSTVPNPALPTATVMVKRTGKLPALKLTFTIDPATQRLAVSEENAPLSTITDDSTSTTLAFNAWRNRWHGTSAPASPYMGYYTLGLNIPAEDEDDASTTVPQGVGYAAFTVAKNGTLTLSGKTADGEGITGGQFVGPDGDILVFVPLYSTKPKGSIAGAMYLDDSADADAAEDGDPTNNVFKEVQTVDWVRPANAATSARIYAAGIRADGTPLPLTVVGGYAPVMLPPLLPTGVTNGKARLDFGAGGLPNSEMNPSVEVTINGKTVTVPKFDSKLPINPNPGKTTLSVDTKTGVFKGAFALEDNDPRAVPEGGKPWPRVKRTGNFVGIIINNGGEVRGFGSFLLPQLPGDQPPTTPANAPILSGWVDFSYMPQ
jgi:uncharacterized delta-60 repeat protein